MSIALSATQLRRLRLQNQLLTDNSRSASAAEVVGRLCAIQSQEWPSAQLAIQARARGITQTEVASAREVERAFVLSWTLRGTLHLVPAEDIRWQLALCGPGAIRATRRRYQQLGLSEPAREEGLSAIQSVLSQSGALTRAELAQALEGRGLPVAGQAIHHLVRFAALRGLICLGPERAGELAYVLLDDWLPPATAAVGPQDSLRHFARRYLEAYGPASAADFARWSGLSAGQAKAAWSAIADACATVSFPGGEAQMLQSQLDQIDAPPPETGARFLPRYDNCLLAYESRAFMVAAAHARQVHPGGGLIRACVSIDGQARAAWKLEKRRRTQRLAVTPYEGLSAAERALLEAEAELLGAFLENELELRVAGD